MKKLILLITIFISTQMFSQNQTAAVIGMHTSSKNLYASDAESLLRIELTKTGQFNVYDKQDLLEVSSKQDINLKQCFGKECLRTIGEAAKVDKVFSGSVEYLMKKIVITIKVFDVASNDYDKIVTEEFINLESEIQLMVQITLNKALQIESNKEQVEKLIYYNVPLQLPTTHLNNSGPRMGVAYVGGDLNRVLTTPESEGGYNVQPVLSQFGYQLEKSYMSSGNFQALAEGMFIMTGVEQGLFNPSLLFMNGFRSSKNGWEIAFGPSINFKKSARGYYDNANKWHLESEWESGHYEDVEKVDINGDTYIASEYVDTPNPFQIERRLDKRGDVILTANWVWAVGKTFHSGYLNIPVNAYFSHSKEGWMTGLSVGFNIANKNN